VPTRWRNLTELDQIVTKLLAMGRAKSAAELRWGPTAERATLGGPRRVATASHLGDPRGRAHWQKLQSRSPGSVDRDTRVAFATYLVEGDFEAAQGRTSRPSSPKAADLFEGVLQPAVLGRTRAMRRRPTSWAPLKATGWPHRTCREPRRRLVASGSPATPRSGGGGRGGKT
jgi:hypothetical protein